MKIAAASLATLLLAGIGWSAPALAQAVPQGTYLQSCADVGVRGDTLIATCRTRDGREQRSALTGLRRCVGDIGNNNGILQCAGGRGQVVAEPGSGYREGYGERRHGGEGYGSERRERCGGLHRESEELRARLDREWNPVERARIEGDLRAVHEQQERCR